MKKIKFLSIILCLAILFSWGSTLAEKSSAGIDDFKKAKELSKMDYHYSALFFAGRAYENGYTDDSVVEFIQEISKVVSDKGFALYHEGKSDLSYSHYYLLTSVPCVPAEYVEDAKANMTFIPPFK